MAYNLPLMKFSLLPWGSVSFYLKRGDLCTVSGIISLATDVTNVTLGASSLWLGTQTGAGGTATLA